MIGESTGWIVTSIVCEVECSDIGMIGGRDDEVSNRIVIGCTRIVICSPVIVPDSGVTHSQVEGSPVAVGRGGGCIGGVDRDVDTDGRSGEIGGEGERGEANDGSGGEEIH